MALIKIYALPESRDLVCDSLALTIKLIGSAALNCHEIPTTPNNVEVVFCEGIDLAGIDYIVEIVACERPNLQKIGDDFIAGLNVVYPDKLFSVYFNIIEETGMANSFRPKKTDKPLTMEEAISISKS